jgi:hypothetical protein
MLEEWEVKRTNNILYDLYVLNLCGFASHWRFKSGNLIVLSIGPWRLSAKLASIPGVSAKWVQVKFGTPKSTESLSLAAATRPAALVPKVVGLAISRSHGRKMGHGFPWNLVIFHCQFTRTVCRKAMNGESWHNFSWDPVQANGHWTYYWVGCGFPLTILRL